MAGNNREEKLKKIIELEKVLNEIQDIDVLLERIITEARAIVHADAGSIYVYENNRLKIRYAQNDTHQKKLAPGQKLPYNFFSFDINEQSICGYAVLTNTIMFFIIIYCLGIILGFLKNSYSLNILIRRNYGFNKRRKDKYH